MGKSTYSTSFEECAKKYKADTYDKMRRMKKAIKKGMDEGAEWMKENTMPVAFSELRDSVNVTETEKGVTLTIDAPHAVPVEVGSRPHVPPIKPLIRWVTLRNKQGALGSRQRKRLPGETTKEAAETIHERIQADVRIRAARQHSVKFRIKKAMSGKHEKSDEEKAIESLAYAIRAKIAREGTKPQWYLRRAKPKIEEFIDKEVKKALDE